MQSGGGGWVGATAGGSPGPPSLEDTVSHLLNARNDRCPLHSPQTSAPPSVAVPCAFPTASPNGDLQQTVSSAARHAPHFAGI